MGLKLTKSETEASPNALENASGTAVASPGEGAEAGALSSDTASTLKQDDGHITQWKSHGGDEQRVSEPVAPVRRDEPVAKVGVDKSMTVNLGNYNSVRFGVSVWLPCASSEVDETFETANEWTNQRLNRLYDEVSNS